MIVSNDFYTGEYILKYVDFDKRALELGVRYLRVQAPLPELPNEPKWKQAEEFLQMRYSLLGKEGYSRHVLKEGTVYFVYQKNNHFFLTPLDKHAIVFSEIYNRTARAIGKRVSYLPSTFIGQWGKDLVLCSHKYKLFTIIRDCQLLDYCDYTTGMKTALWLAYQLNIDVYIDKLTGHLYISEDSEYLAETLRNAGAKVVKNLSEADRCLSKLHYAIKPR